MTSFLSLDGKIVAWSSSFRSTTPKPDEAMRVLEGKAFKLDSLTARQLSFACLYLASANWFGEVLVRFWSLRGHKTFKMMKIGAVAGENHEQMVGAKRRHHRGRPSPDEASRGQPTMNPCSRSQATFADE
ncbi:hypothetical protein IGI04_000861 [Brassica rapa subsp. trilocularis]|uniref:Uncharacterized protein n=1 Tax=Brassica rapa subsp. trilocularis TaxID=1813537 RepID=A0ABQ7NUC0_BRACM|nr:hypothetical protein IGI04_000861 [Brassica rapa subsp. trilocularis]